VWVTQESRQARPEGYTKTAKSPFCSGRRRWCAARTLFYESTRARADDGCCL